MAPNFFSMVSFWKPTPSADESGPATTIPPSRAATTAMRNQHGNDIVFVAHGAEQYLTEESDDGGLPHLPPPPPSPHMSQAPSMATTTTTTTNGNSPIHIVLHLGNPPTTENVSSVYTPRLEGDTISTRQSGGDGSSVESSRAPTTTTKTTASHPATIVLNLNLPSSSSTPVHPAEGGAAAATPQPTAPSAIHQDKTFLRLVLVMVLLLLVVAIVSGTVSFVVSTQTKSTTTTVHQVQEAIPNLMPTRQPSASPEGPSVPTPTTAMPAGVVTFGPTRQQQALPADDPTHQPTTMLPSVAQTETLSSTKPTLLPTTVLSTTISPTVSPTKRPTSRTPTLAPTTNVPTYSPTTLGPTRSPTLVPTVPQPVAPPTVSPVATPSVAPSIPELSAAPSPLPTTTATTTTTTESAPRIFLRQPSERIYLSSDWDDVRQLHYSYVALAGVAREFETDDLLPIGSMRWTTNRTDLQAGLLGIGGSLVVQLFTDHGGCNDKGGGIHLLTLQATNSQGITGYGSKTIQIRNPCPSQD